MLAKTNLCNNR